MPSFELFIARRYLRSKSKTAFISTITYISFFGIMLGVAVLSIVMSVMNGFETEVKTRFIANDSHLRVRAFRDRPFEYNEKVTAVIKADSIIIGASPYIEMYSMVKSNDYTEGALVRGIDVETIEDTSPLKSQLIAGNFEFEKGENEFPGIVLGKGLADKTGVIPGDKIRIISPALSSTFSQPPVKSFIVTGIFETGLAEIDGALCYIALPHAQKLYRMKDKVNGVYLKLSSLDHTDATKDRLNDILEFPLNSISWKDLHSNLFAWFEIEKMMMGTILSLIIIIAAFNILSSLIMIVMEKKQEVGILMAMGANKWQVMKIFIYQGMMIGVIGTILGLALGIGISWLQLEYQIVSLPGDIYFITALPVQMRLNDFLMIGGVSLILTFISTLYPSRQASKMLPAETIRNE